VEHVKRKSREAAVDKNIRDTSLAIAAILVLAVIALVVILSNLSTKSSGQAGGSLGSIKVYNTTYFISYDNCSSYAYYRRMGITEMCTEILNISSPDPNLPSYFIINKYTFYSSKNASMFIQNLPSDLNTSPWNKNLPSASIAGNITYTSVIYPNYTEAGTAAEVLAAYVSNGNTILSVSTSNITTLAPVAYMKSYTIYLLRHFSQH